MLRTLPGVLSVAPADVQGTVAGFEIDSEKGRDIRRDLARAIVSQNWGLLELRPSRMSLEEIFLSLTTEEKPVEKPEETSEERHNE
jgi:ABC-2 type transport system ATP-binding protein